MTALYIIGGIILFFVLVFSVRVHIVVDYGENTFVSLKWLFLNIPLVDSTKPKKEKKPKKKKAKEEKPKDENKNEKKDENKPKKKSGNSLFKQLYLDQGYDGIEKMLYNIGKALGGFFGKLFKTVTVDEFYLKMIVVGNDSAETAISYGKLCSWLFPVLGKLVSACKVKKYDVDVSPDFLGNKKEASLYANVHITPIQVTNAAVVLVFSLVFKVIFKIIFSNQKRKKSATVSTDNTDNKNIKEPETNNGEAAS